MSSAYTRTLELHEHIVPIEKLGGTEPVTTFGTYFGEYNGVHYRYQAGINSQMCPFSSPAKSDTLLAAEAKYISLFCQVRGEQIPFYKNYEDGLPHYLFWDQHNDAMCDRFVKAGLLPSQEEFVLTELGIDALLL